MNETLAEVAREDAVSKEAASHSIRYADIEGFEDKKNQAERNLGGFLAPTLEASGVAPLTATLAYQEMEAALQCAFNGNMTPAQFQELRAQLVETLATHPVLGPYKPVIKCEQMEDGHVSLHADLVGLKTRDYVDLIHALAGMQHDHDNHTSDTGVHHVNAHDVHDKMVSAGKNLKALIESDAKKEGLTYGDFSVNVSKGKGSKPNTFAIDLRLDGLMDRSKGQPKMGPLARAFYRKRGSGAFHSAQHDEHDDHIGFSDDGHHMHIDGLSDKQCDGLLNALARPSLVLKNMAHLGTVGQLALSALRGSSN